MHIGHLLFGFHGRINRKQWWYSQITVWLFSLLTMTLYHKFGLHIAILSTVITLVFYVIRIMLNIKRQHDRGKSAWWLVVYEIPVIGWIWGFIALGFLEGTEGENKHGEAPSAK